MSQDDQSIIDAIKRLESKIDSLDRAVRGDGNGTPGLSNRVTTLETKAAIGQWVGGIIGGTALAALVGTLWSLMLKFGRPPTS